jgi:hypothetical protein
MVEGLALNGPTRKCRMRTVMTATVDKKRVRPKWHLPVLSVCFPAKLSGGEHYWPWY